MRLAIGFLPLADSANKIIKDSGTSQVFSMRPVANCQSLIFATHCSLHPTLCPMPFAPLFFHYLLNLPEQCLETLGLCIFTGFGISFTSVKFVHKLSGTRPYSLNHSLETFFHHRRY